MGAALWADKCAVAHGFDCVLRELANRRRPGSQLIVLLWIEGGAALPGVKLNRFHDQFLVFEISRFSLDACNS